MEVNSATTTILSRMTFRDAIWLFPPAFTLHVLEEWPRSRAGQSDTHDLSSRNGTTTRFMWLELSLHFSSP